MSPAQRWKVWLVGYGLIGLAFALAWWNDPANVGGAREGQRIWLALGYSIPGVLIFLPPLVTRRKFEEASQRNIIIAMALYMAVALWWVAFLPSDPFGCSRVEAPDCHTNPDTRWRAFVEITSVWVVAFVASHLIGSLVARRRATKELAPSR